MTNKAQPCIDRLLAALARKKGDRIPNFEIFIDTRNASHILNRPSEGFWSMPAGDAVELVTKIGQDAIVCNCSAAASGPVVASPADIDRLTYTDPGTSRKRMVDYVAAVKGTQIGVCARIGGPLTYTYMACAPVPIQSFMYLVYDEPDLIEEMVERYTRNTIAVIEAISDLPFDIFYLGDDLSSNQGPMISHKMLNKIWAPRYHRIIRAMQATERPIINHCCGDQSPVLPFLREWGVNATHPIQPGPNDIYTVHEKYGDSLCLVGNIDVAGILSHGTPSEVYADTARHIERLGQMGGYVVCSSHSIIDSVPPDNYLAMVQAAHEKG